MTTIADNIDSMAKLVADMKAKHDLSEETVLRLVDMNFALAQQINAPTFSGDEELPDFDTEADDNEQLVMFPNEDEEVLATVEPPTPLEN